MENPFVYGEVVPAGAFVDRQDELKRLAADLVAGQKVFLISPRRYGKSSLISRALASAARGGLLTVEVTVSSYSSYLSFLEGYARAVLAAETRWSKAVSWLRDAIGATRPEIRLETDPHGLAGVAVSFPAVRTARDVARLAPEVFALPARLADARHRRVVVALDEFQAIGSFNGGSVEEALRAAVQHQRQVGYVFAGSEPSLMEAMLGPRRPFYKAGPVMRLQKIPAEPFASFIEQRFAKTGSVPRTASGWPSSISPVTCRTTSSASRTKRGTMRGRRARSGWASSTSTSRCDGCSPSRPCSSRRPGSGSRSRSARPSARSCSRTASASSAPTCARAIASAARRRCRRRWQRCSARTS